MKMRLNRHGLGLVVVALLAGVCGVPAHSQDVDEKPNSGTSELKAGFLPDPVKIKVVAGGNLQTDKGGVTAWISKAPDYRVVYKAGQAPLTFHVMSEEDTTLLINLPNGKWVANDDRTPDNVNPLIKIIDPQSGRYEIWVGTLEKKNANATLHITELK